VVELALEREQVLDVLLAEEADGALIVLDLEGFGHLVPRLILVDLKQGLVTRALMVTCLGRHNIIKQD